MKTLFVILNFGDCDLFVICDLLFGISSSPLLHLSSSEYFNNLRKNIFCNIGLNIVFLSFAPVGATLYYLDKHEGVGGVLSRSSDSVPETETSE